MAKYFLFAAVFLIGTNGSSYGYTANDVSAFGVDEADSIQPIVDSIIIDNRNIFDLSEPEHDRWYYRLANKLHKRTRKSVIERELLFRVGEPYPVLLGEETSRNLRDLLQLYDSWIELDTLPNGHVVARVVTVDEWTLSFGPSFEREGGETLWEFVLNERNLFGRNQKLQMRYVSQTLYEDYYSSEFLEPRVFGKDLRLNLRYSGNPLDKKYLMSLSRPYYNLNQQFSFYSSIAFTGGRQDVYDDTTRIGESDQEGDNVTFMARWRAGSYLKKVSLTGFYRYLFETTFDQRLLTSDPVQQDIAVAALPLDSTYHLISASVNYSDIRFMKTQYIDGFDNTEDFTLGHSISLTYGRTFDTNFDNIYHDNIAMSWTEGYEKNGTLLYLNFLRKSWFKGSTDFRRYTSASLHLYSSVTYFLTTVLRASYIYDWRDMDVEGLILGNNSGLRGFNEFFRTGNRIANLNLEGRFFPRFSVLSTRFSPVLFSDLARAFKAGDSFSVRDYYVNVGIGLRIAPEHSSREKLLRLDLAYSEVIGWQISIGTDQYFKAQAATFRLTSP